ncbi:Uncharacterised protein [Pantoea agglomerans]|uniref:Uncharacterized protein n=1 Tax=Enterobacter agglomerans TaxID=549 RepID=A0A379LRT5_ENTAG|nr:Uncharacterised protein [Pantoea agglomerans]
MLYLSAPGISVVWQRYSPNCRAHQQDYPPPLRRNACRNTVPMPFRKKLRNRLCSNSSRILKMWLIYILLAAAVITAIMGHWVDTFVIIGVAVINALIGLYSGE